jgi:hypothetical protein
MTNPQLSADFPDRKEGTIPRREFIIGGATVQYRAIHCFLKEHPDAMQRAL